MLNPATLIDCYKFDHRRQYSRGITRVYSNWTPRASRVAGVDKVVYFGGQFFFQHYLMNAFREGFFSQPEDHVCKDYQSRLNSMLGPNTIGTDHIRALHRLGYIPLKFSSVPEGTLVPLRVPMMVVENTHPDFAWLPNYFETLMSNVLWQPCTSSTTAYNFRKVLDAAAKRTGSPPEFTDWQGHDFSFRGMSGPEAAALSGAGHLLFFTGTDTVPALDLIDVYYGTGKANYLIGGSVAATEHSVMCAGGQDGEMETFERLLDLYPSGIVSVVSDTWDLFGVIQNILPKLKSRIMSRDGKLVIRPDSGNPADIICGDPGGKSGAERRGVVELLWDIFGGTTTSTGHRVLDSHIGTIYGDSITQERAREITDRLAEKGFASCNVVFGIGSYTYQYVTRDTYGFAMKATWVEIDGQGRDIYKTPKTDNGIKNSARGRLAVVRNDAGDLMLIERATPEQEAKSELRPVWQDGHFLVSEPYDVIRERARSYL